MLAEAEGLEIRAPKRWVAVATRLLICASGAVVGYLVRAPAACAAEGPWVAACRHALLLRCRDNARLCFQIRLSTGKNCGH